MSDQYAIPTDLDERACPRCGNTALVPETPPQGDPHRCWFCPPCQFLTTGSKAEAFRYKQDRLVEAALRADEKAALERHRQETEG